MKDNERNEPLPPSKNFEPSLKMQNRHANNSLSKYSLYPQSRHISSITEKLIQCHSRFVFYSHMKINL
jgi:hypothetical protein